LAGMGGGECNPNLKAEDSNINKNGNKSIDMVFTEYLNYISALTNQNQFFMMFKFIVLFRDCINLKKSEEIPNLCDEFTKSHSAESIPEYANNLFLFFEKSNYYGWESDKEKFELVEITQHLCYWVYEKQYTSLKLTIGY